MKKRGITLISIVIYVVLFFAFMTFAVSISTNLNYTSLSHKGKAINVENFQKLQYNMLNSAKSSISVDIIDNSIVFSNNDEYKYDVEEKNISKNNAILVSNVIAFEVIELNKLNGVPSFLLQQSKEKYINIDKSKQYVCVKLTFEKYGTQTTSEIFVTVGDDVNENK